MILNRRRLLCLALALSLLLSLCPGKGVRAASARYGITLVDKVIVRYGASSGAKIAFYLPANHVCEIKEDKIAEKIHWYKVETLNPERENNIKYTGYIHGDFFQEMTAEEVAAYLASGTVSVTTATPASYTNNGEPTPTPTPAPICGRGPARATAACRNWTAASRWNCSPFPPSWAGAPSSRCGMTGRWAIS